MMWADYSRYYFGDFATPNRLNGAFLDDITSGVYTTATSDFGFTAQNGGNSGANSQWYFSSIDILHFHNNIYDLYSLLNPRIVSFDPDSMDFEQGALSMIDMQFAYEALIFQPNYNDPSANQPEFTTGLYNGNTQGTQADYINEPTSSPASYAEQQASNATSLEQLYGNPLVSESSTSTPDYRYYGSSSTGGLGVFGNFIFGSTNPNVNQSSNYTSQLSYLSSSNPAIAATLGLGSLLTNPLAVSGSLSVYGATAGYVGAPPQYPGVSATVAASMSGNYGTVGQQIAQGILASNLSNNGNNATSQNGLMLSAAALSVINSQRAGSAQYGYNPYTTPTGVLYGYQGSTGVTTPVGLGNAPQSPQTYGGVTQAPAYAQTTDTPTGTPAPAIIPVASAPLPTIPQTINYNYSPDYSDPTANAVDPDTGVSLTD
jgi:hypothetical protein